MKKEYIIGAVALAAVVGGYLWYKSTKKDDTTTTPTPPADPLEGKLISIGNTEGKYAGAGVFKYFKGKKYVYPSPVFDQFVKNNTDKGVDGYTGLVILSQDKLDAIPLGGANLDSPDSFYGSAKLIGLYQGKDVYLSTDFKATAALTSGSYYRIKGDKKYAWTSADWTALTNKTNQLAVTQDVLNLFTDGGAYTPTAAAAFSGQIFANANGIFLNSGDTQIWK